jgi:hypothetical protein
MSDHDLSVEQKITAVEEQLVAAKEASRRYDQLVKLLSNREFRALIVEGFCQKDCARFAQASGDPALGKDERENSMAMAQAAGHLRRWLDMECRMSFNYKSAIPEIEETLEQLRAGVLEGDA